MSCERINRKIKRSRCGNTSPIPSGGGGNFLTDSGAYGFVGINNVVGYSGGNHVGGAINNSDINPSYEGEDGFYSYDNTLVNISGSYTTLQWGNISSDLFGGFNVSNGIFTPNKEGIYLFSISAGLENTGGINDYNPHSTASKPAIWDDTLVSWTYTSLINNEKQITSTNMELSLGLDVDWDLSLWKNNSREYHLNLENKNSGTLIGLLHMNGTNDSVKARMRAFNVGEPGVRISTLDVEPVITQFFAYRVA